MKGKKTGGKTKGTKNKETVAKQVIVANLWDKCQTYITGKGLKRYMAEMEKAAGIDFMKYYLELLKYFKPQLSKTALTDGEGGPLEITLTRKVINDKS